MTVRRLARTALASIALILLAGCSGDSAPTTAETDEPLYQQGLRLKKMDRPQEAFVSFLKVIEKRGERAAPESHFEVGLIYFTNFKDYVEAIHHFKKYLELKPNSPQAQNVVDLINTAKREFLRSMPARPPDDYAVRPQETAEIDDLRRQNAELRAQLATLQGGAAVPVTRSTRGLLPVEPPRAAPPPADDSPFALTPAPRPATAQPSSQFALQPPNASRAATAAPTRPAPSAPTRPAQTPSAPASGRRYKVAAGEGLYAIARKFDSKNVGAKVNQIIEANPEVFHGNVNARLNQGTELRIP